MLTMTTILVAVVAAAAGVCAGYVLHRRSYEAALGAAEERSRRIVEEAERKAEAILREASVEAREQVHRLRTEAEAELREKRSDLQRQERRLLQKEEQLDRKLEQLERREEQYRRKEQEIEEIRRNAEEARQRQLLELERISGLTKEEARRQILESAREEAQREAAQIFRELEQQAREEADRVAREIVSQAVQRCAADHVAELSVSVVHLPSDDMKGRIIGREGRNIRTFEALTGVDLIIDDTPEAVVISAFEPIRREIARLTLEKLIADGRIHPARIEEMYAKAEKEIDNVIREAGEQACYEARVHGMHPELVRILGRLKFRTSYGQNVLRHSIEVAHLAGLMASQLGCSVEVARRAGLLHDIGKAMDHDMEGTHVQIGMELLRKYGESEAVVHAMSTHHGDFEAKSVEAVLVTAADALSAARPGARRESLEAYIKRLEQLEAIADSFEGVAKAYAIQAGREIRIMVKPDQIDDLEAYRVAKDIVKRIENEVQYPGQIKVTVIRELRAVEYAR
ncbi:MAG: ribonuclease Y [Clostridia bacterium]|nr:ribonuclease Y [Clostridia bacterium]